MPDRDVDRLHAGEARESLASRLRVRFGLGDSHRSQVTEWLEERGAIPMAIAAGVLGIFLVIRVVSGLLSGG